MWARAISLFVLCVAFAGATIVFFAASATDHALAMGRNAAEHDGERRDLLNRANAEVRNSWVRPTAWHAGAAEAASWINALRAAERDREALSDARNFAEHTLALAPAQAVPWLRLAAMDAASAPSRLCEANACLENSWRAARVIEAEPACRRLQMGVQLGLVPNNDDPRISDYVTTVRDRRIARLCLAELPPERSFPLLLRWR